MSDNENRPRLSTEVFQRVAQLPADAAGLLNSAEQTHGDLQLGTDWFSLLEQSVFTNSDQIRYFVLKSDGQAVAVLPMCLQPSRAGNDAVTLSNFYTSWYHPPLAEHLTAADLRPLLDAVRREAAPLRSIRLAPMDRDAKDFGLLEEALRQARFSAFGFFCFGNWFLETDSNWSRYLAGRDGKMRGTIKRMTRRLFEQGGRLEILTDPSDAPRAIMAYEHVYAKSWKVPEPFPTFIPDLVRLCANRGWLRMGIAWLGDVPIAAQLWIVRGRKASIFKLAYDESFSEHSPGTVLSAAMMQHVFEVDSVLCVDFLSGDDPYKKKWMSHRRERWGLVAYDQRTAWGQLSGLRERLARLVKPALAKYRLGLQKNRIADPAENAKERT